MSSNPDIEALEYEKNHTFLVNLIKEFYPELLDKFTSPDIKHYEEIAEFIRDISVEFSEDDITMSNKIIDAWCGIVHDKYGLSLIHPGKFDTLQSAIAQFKYTVENCPSLVGGEDNVCEFCALLDNWLYCLEDSEQSLDEKINTNLFDVVTKLLKVSVFACDIFGLISTNMLYYLSVMKADKEIFSGLMNALNEAHSSMGNVSWGEHLIDTLTQYIELHESESENGYTIEVEIITDEDTCNSDDETCSN